MYRKDEPGVKSLEGSYKKDKKPRPLNTQEKVERMPKIVLKKKKEDPGMLLDGGIILE